MGFVEMIDPKKNDRLVARRSAGRSARGARGLGRPWRAGAAMLLEVVMAVAILAGALAVIGGQINSGFVTNMETEVLTDAVFLAEAKMAEIDSGLIVFEEEMEGDFGEGFPGYGWRILIEPNEIEDLFEIEVQILRGEKLFGEEEYTYDEQSEIVHRVHTLRARPATVDLVRDFGISEEQLVELSDSIPVDGIDLTNLNPQDIVGLDIDQLMELFGALGGGLESLLGMPGVAQRIQDALGGGELEDLLNNLGAGDPGAEGGPGNAGEAGPNAPGAPGGNPAEGLEELPSLEELEEMLEQGTLGRQGSGGQGGNRGPGGRRAGGRGQGGGR